MKAMHVEKYGVSEVVELVERPKPTPGVGEVLVRVRAAGVTTGDWRMKGAEFPGGFAVIGRLMFGLRGPRQGVLGGDFAGEVAALGEGTKGFQVGQRVYGFSGHGAHAEYLVIKADGAIAPIPSRLTFEQAAALPFGMLSAHQFLTKFAKVNPGDDVLVIGASGGVGVYGTQIASMHGARVTAVASSKNHALLERLGASAVIDYRDVDPLSAGPFDLVFDCVGASRWNTARRALKRGGTYVPLNFAIWDIVPALLSRFGPRRFVVGVNEDTRADLDALAPALETGALTPVINTVYPFGDIRSAYAHVASRHRKGAVVLSLCEAAAKAASPRAKPSSDTTKFGAEHPSIA